MNDNRVGSMTNVFKIIKIIYLNFLDSDRTKIISNSNPTRIRRGFLKIYNVGVNVFAISSISFSTSEL